MGDKDFFLSPDDAQSLGDAKFMRKSVRVRRTFPKTLKNPNGFETVSEVSSVEDRSFSSFNNNNNGNGNGASFSTPNFQPQSNFNNGSQATPTNSNGNGMTTNFAPESKSTASEPAQSPEQRRQSDNSMDMFRNMARNIRKR